MHKVYIWGTGYWGENCFQDILDGVEVCGFVESSVSQCSFQGKQVISGQELEEQEYDYVILANTHEDAILERFHLEEHKTIRYRERPALAGVRLFKYQINDQVRGHMPYLSTECDGLYFLYNRTDLLIPNAMSFYKSTWSRAEMLFFWREAPRRDKGIFLDIGANIGTTAIYFRKKLAPDLNYIAFEPVRENVKVLKINCISQWKMSAYPTRTEIWDLRWWRPITAAAGSPAVNREKVFVRQCGWMPMYKKIRYVRRISRTSGWTSKGMRQTR